MRKLWIAFSMALSVGALQAQDVFTLKPELVEQHPRILFTQAEADAQAILAQKYMPTEWQLFVNDCKNIGYTTNTSILGQQQWWYFSRLAIGIAMTRDQSMIDKGSVWLATAYNEDWAFDADKTVGLDVSHKLAGFALLYDCMYNYLTDEERDDYDELMETGLVKFRTHGYDIGDYWTNDYQNNHMHFRATASLYCAAILYDKFPGLQDEYNNVATVWRRIGYMSPPDGSNHEGLNYSNYGGQMLFPGIYGLKHCTGVDLTANEHYHNIGYYYIHHLVPGMVSGFGFGDAGNSAAASGPNYLFQIANFTRDPYIQYTAHQLRKKHEGAFFLRQWFILFNDPLLEQRELTDLPLTRYFDDIGIVTTRTDWGADATAVAFKCGPLGGKLINETRSTEYSWFTDYVNVAHDDPDQGTFLLFTKGQFLTTGDGYEKTNKTTLQHSTFIVDDQIQYGGGGPWCQPEKDQSRYAYPKDFFAVDDRVVFSGDMKGVYPNMDKLDRTFVSQKAKYIVIYDDAASSTTGRTFEWRLQTEGTLTSSGDKTYKISRGDAGALVKILSPADANWSTTASTSENIDGRILRARLEGQQDNKYLVVLWPNASSMNAITENYNTATALGLKVTTEGKNEYTLFRKQVNEGGTAGNIGFNGNTLLLVEDEAEGNLVSASLVNGETLVFNSVHYLLADNKINFGIESISPDTSEVIYTVGPSSDSDTTGGVTLQLGGLSVNSTYFAFRDDETTSTEIITDAQGEGSLQIDLNATYKLIVSKNNTNTTLLESAIMDALEIYDAAVEGTSPGEYKVGSKAQFSLEIDSAESVADTSVVQAEVDIALVDLLEAVATFEKMVVVDLSVLGDLVNESNTLHDEAVEGTEEGQYEAGSKAVFKIQIEEAEGVLADTTVSQQEVYDAVEELASALTLFKSKIVPVEPLTEFSDIPWYGDFANYTVNNKTLWEVIEEGDDVVVGMNNYSTTSGQYMLIQDSTFKHFELSFDARSVSGSYPNDIMIVFGLQDANNYSYVKLSSEINESGAFNRIDGPTKFSWILDDYETYCVRDNEWTTYKMVSLDSVLTFYREDEELFTVDPQKELRYSGKLGVGTYYRNRAYFDDIQVDRLVSTVGMSEASVANFSIYPNPSNNKITIRYNQDARSIEIMNLLGQRIIKSEIHEENSTVINISNLDYGVYLTRIINKEGKIFTSRFIKL